MSTKSNENRNNEDEEIIDDEAAEAEDTDSDADGEEDQEDTEDGEDGEEGADEEGSDDEDADGEDDDQEDDEGAGKKKDKGVFVIPEKFKGKSVEDVIKAYQNLEGMTNVKAMELAQQFLLKKGITVKPEDAKKDEEETDEFDIGLTDEEIAKMQPKEFARHMNKIITERATKIATDTIVRNNEIKTNVSREIKEATKAHPHLKENKEYRDIVLSIIEAGSSKGKIITLKEACEKADKGMGIKPSGTTEVKKKPRTEVERADGPSGDGKVPTELDRIKSGMLRGGNTGGFLGGL